MNQFNSIQLNSIKMDDAWADDDVFNDDDDDYDDRKRKEEFLLA